MPLSGRLIDVLTRVLLFAVMALAAARITLFTTYRVAGESMRETLQDGDRILVSEIDWFVHPVTHGDTVIVDVDDEILVKRVVACPGDRIGMRRGRVVLNDEMLAESIPPQLDWDDTFPQYELGSDEYFVLGDHRRVSVDSRDFGPVGTAQFVGTVVMRVAGTEIGPLPSIWVAADER